MTSPPPILKNDVCSLSFSVRHILSCNNGGPVIAHHKKLHDKLLHLDKRSPPIYFYAANASSARAVAYQIKRYISGVGA